MATRPLKYESDAVTVGGSYSDVTANGSTDQTPIQEAIDLLNSEGGGRLVLRKYPYVFTAPVELKSNIEVHIEPGATLTTSMTGTNGRGIFNITDQNNISVNGGKFVVGGSATAITSYGHDTLKVENAEFTGATTSGVGILSLVGDQSPSADSMKNTRIRDCRFYDMTASRAIRLAPSSGRLVEDTWIEDCDFDDTYGWAIHLDAFDSLSNTFIRNNKFKNIKSEVGGMEALAVRGRVSTYLISNTFITGNEYENNITTEDHVQGFVFIYSCTNTMIDRNIAKGSWTTSQNTTGPAFAPGRTVNPGIGYFFTNNWLQGFDSPIDMDSMTHSKITDNVAYECSHGFIHGYGIQKYVNVDRNTNYNSAYGGTPAAGTVFGNATRVKCTYNENIHVDDLVSPRMTRGIYLTGHYDNSDVEVRGNKFYVVNGTLSNLFIREFGDEVTPIHVSGNELHDNAGKTVEWKHAQGNVSGTVTFNVANAPIITATLTGNITSLTLTSGSFVGQTLELRLTQDGTGSRTISWPSNFKKAGGSLTLTTTASATDRIIMKYDGTNWIEVSRALNVS